MHLVFVVLAIVASSQAWAQPYTVVGISDGDTVRVLSDDKREVKCRLYGIDAPEKNQAFGQASKQSLSDLIYRRTVDVKIVDQDRYGRSVCQISLNGLDVNRAQVALGHAWVYRRYCNDASYIQAESIAKAKRVGLWAEDRPTPPWDFRRKSK
jgi:endonuclease YncB( thermonuclease family)